MTGYRVDTISANSSSDSDSTESAALAMKVGSGFQQTSAQSTVDALSVQPVAAPVITPSDFSQETDVESRAANTASPARTEAEMREELTKFLEEYSRLQAIRKQQLDQQAAAGGRPAKTF